MTLDGKILRALFKHERLKPATIRTSQGNIQVLAELRQIMNAKLKFHYNLKTLNLNNTFVLRFGME